MAGVKCMLIHFSYGIRGLSIAIADNGAGG